MVTSNPSTLVPTDKYEADGMSLPSTAIRGLVARADRVSYALRAQRVTSLPGRKLQTRVAKELAFLAPRRVESMYSASRWLGTTSRASLVIVIEPSDQLRADLQRPAFLLESNGEWEDVALYLSERVLLWTCTHERECVVYGNHAELTEWRLSPRPARELRVVAEKLDPLAQAAIRGLTGSG